ncbi:hypothetical protein LJY25_20615 [Hymenobacter sp. BT175]|uniref:hypothetical protein n=1 Tax=Hymenobacter translucens TaxID=2886507 RepID=UPI001D0EFF53|nr:hypothetical protein [Hymenobacter translucens]MCC2548864.1 hypothetical protein [Hymenobacter translucens]
MERIAYPSELPDSFFTLPAAVYEGLPYRPEESAELIQELLRQQAGSHVIVLYTNHRTVRLVGIFPYAGTEAYFGFWETADNAVDNAAAFRLLEEEARRLGKTSLTGPYHFNTYHRYRLRLGPAPSWQQFDREPVNPTYYEALLHGLGFRPSITFESRLLRSRDVELTYEQKNQILEALHSIPFDFIPVTHHNWDVLEDELFELIEQIFGANPAYKPVTKPQFRLLYNRQYAERLCPHSSVLFRDQKTGRLAALSLCHPNYTALNLAAHQHPVFERDYPQLTHQTLLAKTVGVHPNFRQQGLMSLLAAYAMQAFRDYYQDVLFCLMRSDNFSLHFTQSLPVEKAHYALFRKELM